jgi:cytoplasmic FMR1 interacting protein
MNYSDLQPKVFQSFRELGNAVLFCLMLEQSLVLMIIIPPSEKRNLSSCLQSGREVVELNLAALFQHIIPKPYIPKTGKFEQQRLPGK